jgi:hypothetical protein
VSEYAFKMDAQQWRDDPYYVASSEPVQKLTVVASTKADAVTEALRVLGRPADYRVWKVWVRDAIDIRLVPQDESAVTS